MCFAVSSFTLIDVSTVFAAVCEVSLCRWSTVSYVRGLKIRFTLPPQALCIPRPQVVGGSISQVVAGSLSLPWVSTPFLPLLLATPCFLLSRKYLFSFRSNTSALLSAIPLLSSRHQHLFSPILYHPIYPLGYTTPPLSSEKFRSSAIGDSICLPSSPLGTTWSVLCFRQHPTPPSPFPLESTPAICSPFGNTLPPLLISSRTYTCNLVLSVVVPFLSSRQHPTPPPLLDINL